MGMPQIKDHPLRVQPPKRRREKVDAISYKYKTKGVIKEKPLANFSTQTFLSKPPRDGWNTSKARHKIKTSPLFKCRRLKCVPKTAKKRHIVAADSVYNVIRQDHLLMEKTSLPKLISPKISTPQERAAVSSWRLRKASRNVG
ncbi:hypothetical protein TNCV_851441 [Trichonephila clavipes]|nr:hypothetical protein TNCV_851441 [Trichonephila clavipes]